MDGVYFDSGTRANDLPCYSTDRIKDNRPSNQKPIPGSAGDEGAPRPSRGRESDGKGAIEWDVYENYDGTTTYVYSFKGPVQAEFKLVLSSKEEGTEDGRELRRLFEDVWRKLVLLRPPVPVFSRPLHGCHKRDVRGGFSDDIQQHYADAWSYLTGGLDILRVPRYRQDASRIGTTDTEDEGAHS